MLQLDEVHTYYGDSHVLQGVNLEVARGSVVALLGQNGMGKTTTIHSIIGFTPPARGKIIFKGINISGLPPSSIALMGMALVPQGRRIFRSLTVRENLILGYRKTKTDKTAYDLERVYELFPSLKLRSANRGEQLSGGEQQMLAIGRALLTNPDFILMDEPFEGLAPGISKELRQKVLELKKSGMSILLVEQNIEAALQLADYVYIMSKGKIVHGGSAAQLQGEKDIIKRFILL
ncbi:MAG: ABC transporter ATP-binding protein [Clostridia bacterium]|nr:ABC transporter ATP-binding protein [Clostridia bacterium]